LAVFTKESVFTFIPVLVISAAIVRTPAGWREWRHLLLASTLFLAPIALSIAFRYVKIGSMGGYGLAADYPQIVWDAMTTYLRLMLAPINEAVLNKAWVEIVGVITMLSLLVGLVVFGRKQRALLLLVGLWMLLTMIPVLNLAWASDDLQQRMLPVTVLNVPEGTDNLQQNRYVYLVSAGYLVGVAVLLYSAISAARRLRPVIIGSVCLLVLLSAVICWINLRPWHTATVQVNELVDHLLRAIPPNSQPGDLTWYADRVPFKYKGVPLLLSGLGISRVFAGGDYPNVQRVSDATRAPLSEDTGDAFALRFNYDDAATRFGLDYLAGITNDNASPIADKNSPNHNGRTMLWDFRKCSEADLGDWFAVEAGIRCEPGKGLVITGEGADPQLVGNTIDLGADLYSSKFMRIRVSAKYPPITDNAQPVSEWFWKWSDVNFSGERLYTLPIRKDGKSHVYWTFVPTQRVHQPTIELRYDPINTQMPTEINWIAVDFVE
jgi:hypothetical protein